MRDREWSFRAVPQELLDEVDVCEQHAPAAVSFEAQRVHGITVPVPVLACTILQPRSHFCRATPVACIATYPSLMVSPVSSLVTCPTNSTYLPQRSATTCVPFLLDNSKCDRWRLGAHLAAREASDWDNHFGWPWTVRRACSRA